MTHTTEFAKGQRVIVRHQSGTETGSVYYAVEGQVHVRMDDGTICWFPDYECTIDE